jgi:hypothetical protein
MNNPRAAIYCLLVTWLVSASTDIQAWAQTGATAQSRAADSFLSRIADVSNTGVARSKTIERTVKDLGIANENISKELAILAKDRHVATYLLVAELRPIPRKIYYESSKTKNSRHVIACLRALRYLTGSTFTARTKKRLSVDERQFLDFKNELYDVNPDHQLHFFSVWMSRNADFVAPIDAQKQIIFQWKQWQKNHGDSFQYTPPSTPEKSMDQWYWFG